MRNGVAPNLLSYEACVKMDIRNCYGCGGFGYVMHQCPNNRAIKISADIAIRLMRDQQAGAQASG